MNKAVGHEAVNVKPSMHRLSVEDRTAMETDIARLLRQRGHAVSKEGSERDVLLPTRGTPEVRDGLREVLYGLMRSDEFRKGLREWANGRPVQSGRALGQIQAYEMVCDAFGPWDTTNREAVRHRYACTFEWYLSEVLRREFAARAVGFGIRLKDAHPDDEFDCVALLDKGLVFVECKTGSKDLYDDVGKFIRRDMELNADYSFFVYDRDYTFSRDGEDAPDISVARATGLGIHRIVKVSRTGVPNSSFFLVEASYSEYRAGYFLVTSSFSRFEERLRYIIRFCDESRGAFGLAPVLNYDMQTVPFREQTHESGLEDVPS